MDGPESPGDLSFDAPPPMPDNDPDPASPQEPQEPASPEESLISEPPSVFETLGAQYAQKTEDRREVFPILPGRFGGNLAMRAKPIDPAKRKKAIRKLQKQGGTQEAELQHAASIIAQSCEAILVRMEDGGDYVEAQTVPNSGLGVEPVRFDARLGQVVPPLGEVLTGTESEGTIVRLLFKNPNALDLFAGEINLWLNESSPSDEDDEEAPERPT